MRKNEQFFSMVIRTQSRSPTTLHELEKHVDELNRQGLQITTEIGSRVGRLGRKGMEHEIDPFMQQVRTILEMHDQKMKALESEVYVLLDKPRHSPNALTALLHRLFPPLGARARAAEQQVLERDARTFSAKLDEMSAVPQERNQALSTLLNEISEKYPHLDSFPDVPLPQEKRDKAFRDIGAWLASFSRRSEGVSLCAGPNEMQDIGHQFMKMPRPAKHPVKSR